MLKDKCLIEFVDINETRMLNNVITTKLFVGSHLIFTNIQKNPLKKIL
jgi:hypothetical protein